MALWLVRGGKYGEFEDHFLEHDRVCLTWENLGEVDLSSTRDADAVKRLLQHAYPDASPRRVSNWAGQIAGFLQGIKLGDWIVLPRKNRSSIAIGEMDGPYQYDKQANPIFRHWRKVKWIDREAPRSAFDPDLLYSFGALLTICAIRRNDAEARVRKMFRDGVRATGRTPPARTTPAAGDSAEPELDEEELDLEQVAADQIAQRIERQFKGHRLAHVVAAILGTDGYTTHVSPPGPDKGVDILAAPEPFGFGSPRLCVQVKSGDEPVDRPTLDQLRGVMENVGAQHGLLVAWGGFKSTVERETANQFFRVRLWGRKELVDRILFHYDRLPADVRAELPLKRIWTVAAEEE